MTRIPSFWPLFVLLAACSSNKDTGAESTGGSDDDGCAPPEDCSTDSGDSSDGNDSPESAEPLIFETDTPGVIAPAGDLDWYSITITTPTFIRVDTVSDDPDTLDTVASVYDSSFQRIAWEDGYAGGRVSGIDSLCYAWLPAAGTYYVRVEDISTFSGTTPLGGSQFSYTVRIRNAGTGGDEPDSLADAGVTSTIDGARIFYPIPVLLAETGDSDFIRFDLPFDDANLRLYVMQHDEGSALTPIVDLYNRDGQQVASLRDPSPDTPITLPRAEDDRYIVKVSDRTGEGSAQHWTVLFAILDEEGSGNPQEVEPNDTLDAATPVALEAQDVDAGQYSVGFGMGHIGTEGDTDTWQLDVPLAFADVYVSAYTGAQLYGGLLFAQVELLDAAGDVLTSAASEEGSDASFVDAGPYAAGTYYLRFSGLPTASLPGEGWFYLFRTNLTSFPSDG